MKNLRIMALSLAFLPIAAMAQTNIKQAFDKFIENAKVEIEEKHSLARDPQTGQKESQYDTYGFTMSKKQAALIVELEKAFREDSQNAYSFVIGTHGRNSNDTGVQLAVGDGKSGISLGTKVGQKYMYACFLAPEDTLGNHRYAYGVEWQSAGNDDYIVGALVVTYATTQKYRQNNNVIDLQSDFNDWDGTLKTLHNLGGKTIGGATFYTPPTWFDTLTSYITTMGTADLATRRALASRIYSHTKNMKDVDNRDKETARELLKVMVADKYYQDEILQQLLNGALINIK